jgi:GTP-binding protein
VSQDASNIRNIAIIAHVDHGKTTLVDGMLHQTNVFRDNQQVDVRVLDSNDLERERGITITAKNTAVLYKDTTINLVDTPGHADFGSEVERILNMVDGVLILVDAVEGPMPQTRFVLRHALKRGLKAILVVNKIDRPAARPDWVVNETFDLFVELGATDEQADFPVLYTQAVEGKAGHEPDALADNLVPLFETIVEHIPEPAVDGDAPARLLVTTLNYSSYVGKIAIGRLSSGVLRPGQAIVLLAEGQPKPGRVGEVFTFRNLQRQAQDAVYAGSIVAISGVEDVSIGDTIATPEDPRPLPRIEIERPTVRMTFSTNTSPFSGRAGKYLTGRQIRARLIRELESNVALRMDETEVAGEWVISGRGELHLAILIETMRREGYEFSVSQPEVIYREGDRGQRQEPFEEVYVEVPTDCVGPVTEMVNRRKGKLKDTRHADDGTVHSTYIVPTRGMLGFRQPFLTSTQGNGVFHGIFDKYDDYAGAIESSDFGSLVSQDTGPATAYALTNLQQRGTFFVPPGDAVYGGQVVGQHIRSGDLTINVCRAKVGTGHRSKPTKDSEHLAPYRKMSLDDAIEYLNTDDLLEVTPDALRIRKRELRHEIREKAAKRAEA